MSTNQQIRQEIMEILDNNSKNIPDGLYLQICNKLQEFNVDGVVQQEIDIRINDSMLMMEYNRVRERFQYLENIRQERLRNQRDEMNDRLFIMNPDTGRMVLRSGRLGRRLARG